MKSVDPYTLLETFGRARLSPSFFMCDFLYSEIASRHQIRKVPDFPERTIESGRRPCMDLFEPLEATCGRIHVRSGCRSPLVSGFGNEHGLTCAIKLTNFGSHIWDYPDSRGYHCATACIVVPLLSITSQEAPAGSTWRVDTRSPQLQLALVFPEVGCFQYQFNAGEVMPPSSRSTASSIAAESSTSIIYRAVHVRTAWRRAFNHKTLELALHGINGAAGLFAGRVRIDYIMHGGAEGRSRMGGPSNRICRAACIRIWRDLDRARPIDELPSSMNILPKAERRS